MQTEKSCNPLKDYSFFFKEIVAIMFYLTRPCLFINSEPILGAISPPQLGNRLTGRKEAACNIQGRPDILTFAGFSHLLSRPLLGLQQLLDALGLTRHVGRGSYAVSGDETCGGVRKEKGREVKVG